MSVEGNKGKRLDDRELRRYSRQIIMPEVGVTGQLKLRDAGVLIVGAGGLGSPAALYLAAAGVGRLGIVDYDVVEESNLHRQVLYGSSQMGAAKPEAAAERLRDLNPNVNIETYRERLSSDNAREIISRYDVVIDGADNFPTRYLVNDACVLEGKPDVYGSVFRFEGQASVLNHEGGPCYRCLYPEPPPPGMVISCAEGGVLGALPGIVGAVQAAEALKLLLGVGETLSGRLLIVDAFSMRFRELEVVKNPLCKVCGANPEVIGLIDYEAFCGAREIPEENIEAVPEVSAAELSRRIERGDKLQLLDIRELSETFICSIEGSTHIPMQELPDRMDELDRSKDIVVYCRSGERSYTVVEFLMSRGYECVASLAGGTNAWSETIDPAMPRY